MGNTKLFDLSVGQYQMLTDIDPELSIIEQNIYAAAAIKGVTYEEASRIKLKEFEALITSINDFNVNLLANLKIKNKIELDGTKYHIEHKPDKLSSGQLLDVLNIRSKHQGEAVKVMDLLLASMCRPKGKEYGDDGLTLNERAALIRGARLSEVWNIFVFFWTLWNDYLSDTEDSLTEWMTESLEMAKAILDENLDSSA